MTREFAEGHSLRAVPFGRGVELVSVMPRLFVEAPEGRMPVMVVRYKRYLSVIAGPLIAANVGDGWHRRPAWCRLEDVDWGSDQVLRFESVARLDEWIGRTLLDQFQGELAESIFL